MSSGAVPLVAQHTRTRAKILGLHRSTTAQVLSHFRPKPTNLKWKIKSILGVSSLGLGEGVDSSHPTTQLAASSIAKQLPPMSVVDHFGGVKKEFQGNSSSIGYKSTIGGSLSKTMATLSLMLLLTRVLVSSPNCAGKDLVAGVSDVCLQVEEFMDVNTHTSRSLDDGAFVVQCLGVTNFVGGPKALEWALSL